MDFVGGNLRARDSLAKYVTVCKWIPVSFMKTGGLKIKIDFMINVILLWCVNSIIVGNVWFLTF